MKNPWDRPPNTGAPCRPGDPLDTPIFIALGKAVSAWEGVQAAASSLFQALLDPQDPAFDKKVERFGTSSRVHERARMLLDLADGFPARHHVATSRELQDEVRRLVAAYRGWAERRNDLAHGYVTAAQSPDSSDEQLRLVTTYSLLPSHAREGKWINAQPEFNYTASEIETFAREFQELDNRLEALASKAEARRHNSP